MTRELVLEILINVLENGEYSNVAIHNTLMKYQYMEKQNRAFLTRLSEGAIERKMELDYIINTFSKIKVNKMKPVIRNILRMGTYQILYMDQIPDS
ncbi:MAG: transcription antitermination factor NusB, partial [Lachnospiraceae bacterium]